jgi:hypothetical protein
MLTLKYAHACASTRNKRSFHGFREMSPIGTPVSENEGVGCPGVSSAHVQRISCLWADLPCGVQVEQLGVLGTCAYGLRVVVGKGFVEVAVVND